MHKNVANTPLELEKKTPKDLLIQHLRNGTYDSLQMVQTLASYLDPTNQSLIIDIKSLQSSDPTAASTKALKDRILKTINSL
jgi:hypothetical protein